MKDEGKPADLMAFGPVLPDGSVVGVRKCGDEFRVGRLVSPGDGAVPQDVEIVGVGPPTGDGPWHEVKTLYDGRPREESGGRPAMVNSAGFRSGWDAVFGGDKSKLN